MAREKTTHRLAATLLVVPLLLGAAPLAPLEQAVAAQRDLVAERPDNAGVLNDLGNLLVETGELVEAEEVYRRAMTTGPDRAEPPFNLALLLAATERRGEARKLLRAMLEQHPDHAWGHYQLGTLRQARGDRSRALRSYREAFRLDPSLSDPRHNPHVVDNSLATAAMLEAFAMIAPAATTQRIYVEPSRITGLLLPSLTATSSEPMAKPAMGKEMAEEPAEEKPEGSPPG
ncbi:MAG: tetratricopeptide repeat protein [Thermoanaerobaculia bacterium]